jgi:FkbH-like protein
MRLVEAFQIIKQPTGGQQRSIHLLCGFTPLHLETFLKAHLRLRFPGDDVGIRTGLYGDLAGNIRQASEAGSSGAVAVIEWSDLDHRLGLRASAGWGTAVLEDVIAQSQEKSRHLETQLASLSRVTPVAVVGPTLALPPLTYLPPSETSAFELELNSILSEFLKRVARLGGVKVVSGASLATKSPTTERHDVKMDLLAGFPYTVGHADAVAAMSVACLFPPVPKKGLITDLDRTLWSGILGDAGVDGISWSLESKSQAHALYQQTLASLAESGVLVAVASKNDAALVNEAFQRADILLKPSHVFPIEANWGVKSDGIGRILKTWNIAADSVVFVDDSPMELAEVAEKYPGMECLPFPVENPAAVVALITHLRTRFGKSEVLEEDKLRLQSLRSAASLEETRESEASEDFLARLQARITFEASNPSDDRRTFELVNKTNQFNLNGQRYTEAEWKANFQQPGAFLFTVSYTDRFGPLGKIAAVAGRHREAGLCEVDQWVMSCRAFSRHIEFETLRHLFAKPEISRIRFRFKPTERNGPLQSFFQRFFPGAALGEGDLELTAAVFEQYGPRPLSGNE